LRLAGDTCKASPLSSVEAWRRYQSIDELLRRFYKRRKIMVMSGAFEDLE
jgi:hypothetical protein